MQTTSLKLPDEIKQRATLAAQQQGVSAHAFMVSAITQATAAAELRARFVSDALAAKTQMFETGLGYPAAESHAYLKARVANTNATKPQAAKWRD